VERLIKKNIRLLAEKHEHSISYLPNSIEINNEINEISIVQHTKELFRIEFNLTKEKQAIYISNLEIYDVVLQVVKRKNIHPIKIKTFPLLSIKQWLSDEGKSAQNDFNKLKTDLRKSNPANRIMFGNRIEAEYYSGIIILEDIMNEFVSNVVNL